MFLAYAFVSFLFFKIFPAFSGLPSNTVMGALIMALTGALILFLAGIAAARVVATNIERSALHAWDDLLPAAGVAALVVGVVAATAAGYLIAAGFTPDLYRAAFRRGHRIMFLVLVAGPPFAHLLAQLRLWWPIFARARMAAKELADEKASLKVPDFATALSDAIRTSDLWHPMYRDGTATLEYNGGRDLLRATHIPGGRTVVATTAQKARLADFTRLHRVALGEQCDEAALAIFRRTVARALLLGDDSNLSSVTFDQPAETAYETICSLDGL